MARLPGAGYGGFFESIGIALDQYVQNRFRFQAPWGVTKAIKWLEKKFFKYTPGQIKTIAEQGERAFQAGKKLTRNKPDKILERANIPVDKTLPKGTAYRVRTVVTSTDSVTGVKGYTTITSDFARNPSRQVLLESVQRLAADNLADFELGKRDTDIKSFTGVLIEIEQIISIRRRTY